MTTPRVTAQLLTDIMAIRVAPIYTRSILMGLLKARGRIKFNRKKVEIAWKPRYKRQELEPITDIYRPIMDVEEPQLYQDATLPMRGYKMGTSKGLMESLVASNREATHLDFVGTIPAQMAEDFIQGYRLDLYNDGATNTTRIHGLESWYSQSGLLANGYVGTPNGTYAGLNQTWANYGGEWTGVFPNGTGDEEYHFWSSLMVDYNNVLFGGTTATWINQWQHACNFLWSFMSAIQDTTPDVIVLNTDLLRLAKDSTIGQQTLEITQHSDLVSFGHKTVQVNGMEMATEYGVPADVGYCLSFNRLRLMNALRELVASETDREIRYLQDLQVMYNISNMYTESPAYQGKLQGISTPGT